MKVILKFDLNESDDIVSFERCNMSKDMAMFLFDLTGKIKKESEYEIESKKISSNEVHELIFNKIYDSLNEHGINVDKILQ